jgi:putative peptidoglycan lipid II flippase
MVGIQIPSHFKEITYYRFNLDIKDPEVIKFGRLMLPMIFGTLLFGLMGVMEKIFASGLPAGSISALDYSFRIINFISAMFIATVTTAAFPTMSLYAMDSVKDRFVKSVWSTVKMVELFIVPISIFLAVFNVFIVRTIFERGAFTSDATLVTSKVLAVSSLGLAFYAGVWILFHAFYAVKKTKVRIQAPLIILGAYIVSNIVLIRPLGILSLPLSHVLAFLVGLLFLVLHFIRQVSGQGLQDMLMALVKMILAALISVIFVNYIWARLYVFFPDFISQVIGFCLVFIIYGFIYLGIYFVFLKDQEAQDLILSGAKKMWSKG